MNYREKNIRLKYHYARMKRFEFVANEVLTDGDFAHYGRHDETLGITTIQKYKLMKKCLDNIYWYIRTKYGRREEELKRRYEFEENRFIEYMMNSGLTISEARFEWRLFCTRMSTPKMK